MIVRRLVYRRHYFSRLSGRRADRNERRFAGRVLRRIIDWANTWNISRGWTDNLPALPRIVRIPNANSAVTRTGDDFVPKTVRKLCSHWKVESTYSSNWAQYTLSLWPCRYIAAAFPSLHRCSRARRTRNILFQFWFGKAFPRPFDGFVFDVMRSERW